jgi:hypothetical protein|tara:strand:+ start:185 stop:508 length:324 start_codon:yes stop_codon:yes gene_type:complete
MKHLLLILISFLLLSPFLTSCEKKEGTLYRWKTSTGIVWKTFGSKDTNPKYQGEVENGVPNGFGVLIFSGGDKYIGEWKDGKKWNGTWYDENGHITKEYVNGNGKTP